MRKRQLSPTEGPSVLGLTRRFPSAPQPLSPLQILFRLIDAEATEHLN